MFLFGKIAETTQIIKRVAEQLVSALFHTTSKQKKFTSHKSAAYKSSFYAILLYSIFLSDYPWRTATQPLTSNVIKWFYLPDFAMAPNPSFIFCKFIFTFLSLLLLFFLFLLFLLLSDFDPPSLSCSLQMTSSCCSAHLCSGRCLRRRTERRCDCWPETTLRLAVVWILVPSTSSYLSITSFTAGQK